MNKIKFRAWNKKEKVFFYYKNGINVGVMLDGSKAMVIEDEEDVEYLLFTGREDINDKEIYAGDIVKLIDIDGSESIAEIVHNKSNASFEIKEINEDGVDFYSFLDLSICGVKIEVIGSIFENPELLEQNLKGE